MNLKLANQGAPPEFSLVDPHGVGHCVITRIQGLLIEACIQRDGPSSCHPSFSRVLHIQNKFLLNERMSAFEYIATIAFLDWCATHPPTWHPPRVPKEADPTKEIQGLMTKPWVGPAIKQVYFLILAGLIAVAVISHPAEACELKWGPFMLLPGYRVFVALLPGYRPYPGAWDKVKEAAGKSSVPEAYEKAKESAGNNPVIQGLIGPQGT
jgi:hypothetical protein